MVPGASIDKCVSEITRDYSLTVGVLWWLWHCICQDHIGRVWTSTAILHCVQEVASVCER